MEKKKREHGKKVESTYRCILHWLELVIAGFVIIILVVALGQEAYRMVTSGGCCTDLNVSLQNVLTIVVGLEFVRMLIDMTPATTLEVLIMATARHIILNHHGNWTLLVGILCIAILFAVRRFLIRPSEMKEELVENE